MAATALRLDHVSLARNGKTILADVSARIEAGEFIGVFGPNGAGKTTLMHALLGLMEPRAGTIEVLGRKPSRAHRSIGYMPQQRRSPRDFRLRGWDFVASAQNGHRWGLPLLSRAERDEVIWALEAVEARALAQRALASLSGGEQQRLLLAQALLGRPKLLLLDEPLISLDPHFQQIVVELVARIARREGMTVLFSAHELNSLLGVMDRALYLGRGKAVLGTVAEVVTSDVLSRLYELPIEVVHVKDRILVMSSQGEIELEAHRHDA